MEAKALHPDKRPFLEVRSTVNGYILFVNKESYFYFSVGDLIRGMIIHAIFKIRTALKVELYRGIIDIERYYFEVNSKAQKENFNLRYFKDF